MVICRVTVRDQGYIASPAAPTFSVSIYAHRNCHRLVLNDLHTLACAGRMPATRHAGICITASASNRLAFDCLNIIINAYRERPGASAWIDAMSVWCDALKSVIRRVTRQRAIEMALNGIERHEARKRLGERLVAALRERRSVLRAEKRLSSDARAALARARGLEVATHDVTPTADIEARAAVAARARWIEL